MELRGITREQIDSAIRAVNARAGATLQIRAYKALNTAGTRHRLTLRPATSSDPYHRRSQNCRVHGCQWSTCRHNGYRMPYVCWHGHRDVMRAMFALAPDLIIRAGSIHKGGITYRGAEHFERTYSLTGNLNIGSPAYPLLWADACDCYDDGTESLESARYDRDRARAQFIADDDTRGDWGPWSRGEYPTDMAPIEETTPEDDYGQSAADSAACTAMAAALCLGGDSAPTVEDYTAGLARMRERLAATR